MRYPASEKLEIICTVEQSALGAPDAAAGWHSQIDVLQLVRPLCVGRL